MGLRPGLGGLPVHARHATADHREEVTVIVRVGGQERLHRLHFVVRDIHDEVIGRVLGQLGTPLVEQRRADQQQDQQQHDRDAEDRDLGDVLPVAPLQPRQCQPPGAPCLHPHHASAAQQRQRHDGERTADAHPPDEGPQGQEHVAAVPHEEAESAQRRGPVGERLRRRAGMHVAPDHAHRRDAPQGQQRRQRERQQAHESRHGPKRQRTRARQRQRRRQIGGQRRHDTQVDQAPEQETRDYAGSADRTQDSQVAPLHVGRRGPERLEHAHVIVVPARVSVCAERDGHPGEQDRQEPPQQQEALGAVQRIADGRVRIGDAPPAVVGREVRLHRRAQFRQTGVVSRQQQPIAHAAARLDHARRGHVVDVHQEARAEIENAAAAVRLPRQDPGDPQARVTERHGVAQREVERREQARVEPHLARYGHRTGDGGRPERFLGHAQHAAQGVAVSHRLDGHQLAAGIGRLVPEEHRGERDDVRLRKAELSRGIAKALRYRPARADDPVGAEERGGL